MRRLRATPTTARCCRRSRSTSGGLGLHQAAPAIGSLQVRRALEATGAACHTAAPVKGILTRAGSGKKGRRAWIPPGCTCTTVPLSAALPWCALPCPCPASRRCGPWGARFWNALRPLGAAVPTYTWAVARRVLNRLAHIATGKITARGRAWRQPSLRSLAGKGACGGLLAGGFQRQGCCGRHSRVANSADPDRSHFRRSLRPLVGRGCLSPRWL